jgi:carboxyl-terminal processing protease
MSQKSKTIFAIIVGAVALVFLLALVAAGGYAIGRNYFADEQPSPSASPAVSQEQEQNVEPVQLPTPAAEEIVASVEQGSENEQDTEDPDEPLEPTSEPSESQEIEDAPELRIPPDIENDDIGLLLEVWDVIGERYDGAFPSEDEVIHGAIRGSLELLDDQHTRFIPKDVVEQLRLQIEGRYEGIGAFVELNEDGYLEIVRPMEGQPADLAGLRSGDFITHVDGESVLGKTIDQITAAVKGPRGTEVTLTVERDSETFEVTIERKLIEIPIVEADYLEEGIAYIRLRGFSGLADAQVFEELDQLLDQEPAGLIFDLRDNPGGLLNQAVSVSDLFLSEGIILFERDSSGDEKIFRAESGQIGESIPLVILVNKGSASASEILAGAVQDNHRGILIGEQTLGKGSVQQSHGLSDGSELRVTIARWYTPLNISIDKEGITPDIEVETPEEFFNENDTQLQRAIDYILNGE